MEVTPDDFNEELLYVSGGSGLILGNAENATAQSVFKPVVIADQYLAKGRTEKAVEVYQLALRAPPGNDAAKQALTKLGIELSNPATR